MEGTRELQKAQPDLAGTESLYLPQHGAARALCKPWELGRTILICSSPALQLFFHVSAQSALPESIFDSGSGERPQISRRATWVSLGWKDA